MGSGSFLAFAGLLRGLLRPVCGRRGFVRLVTHCDICDTLKRRHDGTVTRPAHGPHTSRGTGTTAEITTAGRREKTGFQIPARVNIAVAPPVPRSWRHAHGAGGLCSKIERGEGGPPCLRRSKIERRREARTPAECSKTERGEGLNEKHLM